MTKKEFKNACEELDGIHSKSDGTQRCVVGSEKVHTVDYSSDKEKAVIRDHKGREVKVDEIDKIDVGTNWVDFERPGDSVMITNAKGNVELNDFRRE